MSARRRDFFKQVGSGMLVAGLGSSIALELGVASESQLGFDQNIKLDFGDLNPWVHKMQDLRPDKLQVEMVDALSKREVTTEKLVAAAALANAETFGGQDYVGYHAEMALIPALQMSKELPKDRAPLPVLKVLYRNSARIQQFGPGKKTIKGINSQELNSKPTVDQFGPELRRLVRQADMDKAESMFANVMANNPEIGFDTLLYTIADEVDVHRFVLAYRGFDLINIAGAEHAHTLLRQCVRHCVDFEVRRESKGRKPSPIRQHIPKLVDEYKLQALVVGNKEPSDKWLMEFSDHLFHSDKFEASRSVAEALADGVSLKSICQAIALTNNSLTLRQPGNPLRTHGATAGVHGSDAANAWRHMIANANDFNAKIGVLVSAWHTGRYVPWKTDAYPLENHFEKIKANAPKYLLGVCEDAIRDNDQGTAAAAIHRYGQEGHEERPVFDLLLKYAISEDGRLHSEKFYRTVVEEYQFARPAFRWRQLVALARVTASAYAFDVQDNHGYRAPGYEEACRLLKVTG